MKKKEVNCLKFHQSVLIKAQFLPIGAQSGAFHAAAIDRLFELRASDALEVGPQENGARREEKAEKMDWRNKRN